MVRANDLLPPHPIGMPDYRLGVVVADVGVRLEFRRPCALIVQDAPGVLQDRHAKDIGLGKFVDVGEPGAPVERAAHRRVPLALVDHDRHVRPRRPHNVFGVGDAIVEPLAPQVEPLGRETHLQLMALIGHVVLVVLKRQQDGFHGTFAFSISCISFLRSYS